MHNTTMTGSERYATEQPCSGCGKPLLLENAWMEDGCPCNTPAGVNNLNLYRWKLLHDLQQKDSRELTAIRELYAKEGHAKMVVMEELAAAKATIDRIEAAGREMPEEPEVATMIWHDKQRAVVPQDAYLELQSYLAAQTVMADMWQARCISLFWRGEADDVTRGKLQEAANKIEAALKEQKT